jgi:hypothetical protein
MDVNNWKGKVSLIIFGLFCLCLITNISLILAKKKIRSLHKEINVYEEINETLLSTIQESCDPSFEVKFQPVINEAKEKGILGHDKSLVLFIDQASCLSCIMPILKDLEILGEEIGYDRISILANYEDQTNIDELRKICSSQLNIYKISFTSTDKEHSSRLMLYDPNINSRMINSPDQYPYLQKEHYDKIISLFAN